MQNHQADSPLYVWPDVWSADLHLLIKSMVIHDTECPYWDQVSLNNTNQTKPVLYCRAFWHMRLWVNVRVYSNIGTREAYCNIYNGLWARALKKCDNMVRLNGVFYQGLFKKKPINNKRPMLRMYYREVFRYKHAHKVQCPSIDNQDKYGRILWQCHWNTG